MIHTAEVKIIAPTIGYTPNVEKALRELLDM
jgi:hypothetical protein